MGFMQLKWGDIGRGLVTSVFAAVLTGLYTSLTATPPHMPQGAEWAAIGIAGATAGVGYLLKNLFTNSNGDMFKGEPKPPK